MLDRIVLEKLHPRLFMNWGEESLIGNATAVASRTHRLTAAERSLDRYRINVLLNLLGRNELKVGKPEWLDDSIINT
jgi:hypothetical protein